MAKIVFGGGIVNASGSLAGNTFSHNSGGSYLRARKVPTNPNTSRQQSVRSSMTDLTTAWSSSLTQAQRDAWIELGQNFPTTDKFGSALILSGIQMYLRQNTTLLQAGLARLDTPPHDLDVQSLLTFTLDVDISDGDFDVTFTPSPLGATSRLQVFATPSISPGITFVKNRLRLLTTQAAATASPLELASLWTAMFGSFPTVGQKVVFEGRVINSVTGSVSSTLQAAAIVHT